MQIVQHDSRVKEVQLPALNRREPVVLVLFPRQETYVTAQLHSYLLSNGITLLRAKV